MLADPSNEGGHPVQAVQAPIFTSNVPVPPKIELSGNLTIGSSGGRFGVLAN